MARTLDISSFEGEEISVNLFGGNILANSGEIYGEGQYDTAINDLGVTSLRYPGGSRTEKSFDINNPDAETVVDAETGQVDDWIALSDFFAYAEENGHPVSIVLPTRFNLSEEVDETGNRVPEFNEDELRTFIQDVASGEYGSPEIRAFEIGNEYWHSGKMNTVEYGRLASQMIEIINDELEKVAVEYPESSNIQITVQMGQNYGSARLNDTYGDMSSDDIIASLNSEYGLDLDHDALYPSGGVNWGYVHNEIIIGELERDGTIDDVDGVISHVYSLGETNTWSRVSNLQNLDDTWMRDYPELDVHVTEWNLKGVTQQLDRYEDYGLNQAEEMLNIMEEFVRFDVDHAQVWPLTHVTDNALSSSWTYAETNAPAAMFRMMADNMPGKRILDFNPENERVTEAEFEHINVHGFAGEGELLLYVIGTSNEGVTTTDLDLSGLLTGFESMELTILGVEEGASIGYNRSAIAELETMDHRLVYNDGVLDVSLDPGEILQVVVRGVVPTDALAPYLDDLDDGEDEIVYDPEITDDDLDLPFIEVPEEGGEQELEDDNETELDVMGDMGLSMLFAAVPILGLLALVG